MQVPIESNIITKTRTYASESPPIIVNAPFQLAYQSRLFYSPTIKYKYSSTVPVTISTQSSTVLQSPQKSPQIKKSVIGVTGTPSSTQLILEAPDIGKILDEINFERLSEKTTRSRTKTGGVPYSTDELKLMAKALGILGPGVGTKSKPELVESIRKMKIDYETFKRQPSL